MPRVLIDDRDVTATGQRAPDPSPPQTVGSAKNGISNVINIAKRPAQAEGDPVIGR